MAQADRPTKPITGTAVLVRIAITAFALTCVTSSEASNTAFRLVKTLVFAGSGSIGDNWISLPYFNPYATAADLCAKSGLVMDSMSTPGATITQVNPANGVVTTGTCGTSSANFPLLEGVGVRIRQPNVAGARAQIVIVGAHDPDFRVSVDPQRLGDWWTVGYWYSVPYNSKAKTFIDLCHELNLTAGGANKGGFMRLLPQTGYSFPIGCKDVAATNSLVAGESYEIIVNNPRSFVPAVN
jgi:hypothetical protein